MALCLPLPFLFGFNSRSPYSTHGSPINPEVAREKKPTQATERKEGKRGVRACEKGGREKERRRDQISKKKVLHPDCKREKGEGGEK